MRAESFDIMLHDCLVLIIDVFDDQFQPVFAFKTLLQSNQKYGDKVGLTVGIDCRPNIGSTACSGSGS